MSSSQLRRLHTPSIYPQALRKKDVPSDPNNLSPKDERAIEKAIDALHHLSGDIKRITDRKLHRPTTFPQLWEEGLLDWLIYLGDNYHPSSEGRWQVISYVSCVLGYFTEVNVYLMFDKRCYCLAERLWQEQEYDHMRSEYSSLHGFWESFLYFICAGIGTIPQGPAQAVASDLLVLALNDGVTIHLLLQRLQACFLLARSSDREYSLLTASLSALLPLYRSTEEAHEQLIVSEITDIIHDILSRILPARFTHVMLNACFKMTLALTIRLQKVNSIDTIRVVIQHKLLESVAMFSKYFDYMARHFGFPPDNVELVFQHAILTVLTDIVPKYMWYQSIQKALCPVMADDNYVKAVRGTRAEDKWKLFRDLHERSMFATNESPFPHISLCDNITHGTSELPAKLYRCSGCQSTWYCSTRCQKSHWDNDHRKTCKNTKNSPPLETLRRRDYISALRFAIVDVQQACETALKNVIQTQHIPVQHTILVDYTVYPWNIDIISRDKAAMKAASVCPNATVIQCRVPLGLRMATLTVPLGLRMATLTVAGNIDNWTKEIWFGGRFLMTYGKMRGNGSSSPLVMHMGNGRFE